ncbi:Stk1 family PASTA domain-containing Ser/Thr kinase [Corynebacterium yudongzhengii]|uniref:non-specific serine/threonine protein kinase n=1 Tax=Corynebacterium yudongzhengii TaxID=2080740 RepID=A0A2U1T549_9CORY|nr:Stk1 family PASTA domain-containing Ser/Thr kinase [Corynebacterium yudongzhengii]AWB80954.1 Stk1 family PASTA domain-containing Ser/Thr kinase [Corynebacterium yudongzhengii]PWC01120.1 Stk1 family PASTA domain-containing Ser/Thr kinase [Corynebacterium yudongzhengii]
MSLLADRYQLAERIGTGGMSNVFAASDVLLGRDVAVKMLKPDMARDDNFRERFRREAQNSAKLNHPNIVAVFDTGETDTDGLDVPYIVMERIHGRTLRDVMRTDGPLSPARAAELLVPVCSALQSSHEAGIIHRDIKPANIMITNTGAVKVMDFGIARALDDATSAMTQTSAVIGTAQYLSPEQARGRAADARSDVYALGCVLYEAVTGTVPFEGESPFAVAYQHVQEDAEAPSARIDDPTLDNTARVNIDAVTLTAMAKHPADRYQSAAEMGEDLERLARGQDARSAAMHLEDAQAESASEDVSTTAFAAAGSSAAASASPAAEKKPFPVAKVLALVLAGLVIVAAGLFGWQMLFGGGFGREDSSTASPAPNSEADELAVPDVSGLTRAEATRQLEELGFEVEVEEEPSSEVDEDRVIRTNPTAGSELRVGTTVTLIASSGERMTTVPDLSGLTPAQARTALDEAGLRLNPQVDEDSSDSVPEGSIIRQSPAPGEEASEGDEVSVTVSTGPELARVPDLTGATWAEAQNTLRSLGFEPTAEYLDSHEDEDRVLAVGGAGEEAPVGSEVIVQVSNGMLIDMPSITRLNPDDAQRALRDAGWEGSPSDFRISPDRPGTGALVDEGLVAGTDPEAGESLRKDAPVTVYIWEFRLEELAPSGVRDALRGG